MVDYKSFGMTSPVVDVSLEAWTALDEALKRTGYNAKSSWAYNCRNIKGSSKRSLHSYGIARDYDPFALGNPFKAGPFSWNSTKFKKAQITAALAIRTTSGLTVFTWGGFWSLKNDRGRKDYMHFQVDVKPSDLKKGIDWTTVGAAKPGSLGRSLSFEEDEDMATKQGHKGGDVTQLQKLLDVRGFPPGPIDGDFGPKTHKALIAYQKDGDLDQTGVAGASTWAILAAEAIAK